MKNTFRATTGADFAAIAELATGVFQLEPENPFHHRAYQDWKYWRPHPDWAGSRSYVMERDGKLTAHGCTWPLRFLGAGREWKGQYLIDWAASSSAAGVGIVLLRQTAALVDGLCVIGGSAMTRAILPKIGFHPFNEMWFAARPLHPLLQCATHQFRNWKLPLRLVRNSVWRWWPPLPSSENWAVVDCAPAAIPDHLWPRPAPGVTVCGRSAAQFEFLLACPVVQFSFHSLTRNGQVAGYFCLATVQRQVRIADLWIASPQGVEDWSAAYAAAFRRAGRIPGAAEVVTVSSLPAGQQALLRCGFRVYERTPVMMHGSAEFRAAHASFHLQMVDADFAFVHENRTDYKT